MIAAQKRVLTPRAGTRSTGARMIGKASTGKDDTGTDRPAAPTPASEATHTATPRKILFIANDLPLPTLEISFLHPLSPLIETGAIVARCVEEFDLKTLARGRRGPDGRRPIDTLVADFDADLIVFCRYSGPYTDVIVNAARAMGRPVIFHIDDDLLNVPRVLGVKKFVRHNLPPRKRALRYLLANADLIYVSTAPLAARLEHLGVTRPMVRGALVCAADVIAPAEVRAVKTIGYMGFDHAHDLKMVLPDLIAFLDEHEAVAFELFGSIPVPSALKRFGPRVRRLKPVRGYDAFMQAFAARRWEIGICPLQPTTFNRLKANNKWVEYTAVGTAVIASRGLVYDSCCAEGCGILIDGAKGWRDALTQLTRNPQERAHMVARAQHRLQEDYTPARLRRQVLDVFDETAAQARTAQWTSH